ncbi:MAG: SDR family oxidoreductase [Deltaproteobacteria bacterium]|nr:SDR family oxidoreductase [Deltaproteobacteria bacterium]MBW2385435.1 SDR family oxidoreductase [Deltaproteobacteria bacterium]MBW2696407.1 SDR family oxidoreductase [Deltaproteobacteria bacterium]
MKRLDGRAVIVTGGGSGIGRGASLRIAEEGGLVGVADIRGHLAAQVAEEIQSTGGTAIALTCDVANEGQVAEMVAKTVGAFGGLYGLVANAGTAGRGWIHETSLEDWHFVLGVNLTGPFLCAKHSLPPMIEGGGGSIVMTSSIAGSVVGAGGSAVSYAVSKHGVIALAKQIAVDYGAKGIRANAIQPSGVDETNLPKHAAEDQQGATTPAARLPRPKPWLPIRRAGKIKDEYGATIAFLLSDDAGYITGSAIPVDGGYLAT